MSAPADDELDLRLLKFRKAPEAAEGLALAGDLIAASRARDAISVYELLRRAAPHDASLPLLAGRALVAIGDLSSAQAMLLEALRVAPEDRSIVAALGEVLLKRGEPVRARDLLERHRGDAAIDKLRARAERLARLSDQEVDEFDEVPEEPAHDRVTAPGGSAPAGPTEEDAEGFFEDVPTAMIDREQLEALREVRASRPDEGGSSALPEAGASRPSEEDTRQIAIPLPEPESRAWAGPPAAEAEVSSDEPEPPTAPGPDEPPPRRSRRARSVVWAIVVACAAVAGGAGGLHLAREHLAAEGAERARHLRVEADRAIRRGEPSELVASIDALDEAARLAPVEASDAELEAFSRAVALLELESGDSESARVAAERVEGPLREIALAAVDFVSTGRPPPLAELPLPSKALDPRASYLLGRLRQASGGDPTVDFELARSPADASVPAAETELALVALARGDHARVNEALEAAPRTTRRAVVEVLARGTSADPTELAGASPAPFDRFLGALGRAKLMHEGGRAALARAELESLERDVARGPLAPLLAARVASEVGALEAARRFSRRAAERSEGEHARAFAATLAVEANDLDAARGALDALGGEEALALALAIARRSGRSEDAATAHALLEEAEVPEDVRAAHRLSLALSVGAPGATLERLAAPLEGVETPLAHLALAELALERERYRDALALAERARVGRLESAVVGRVIGVASLALGDASRAKKELGRAVEQGDRPARLPLAELLLEEGAPAQAAEILSADAVGRLPEGARPAASRTRARALAAAGDLAGAKAALGEIPPNGDPADLALRVRIASAERDFARVVELLEPSLGPLVRARKADEADVPLLVELAAALEATGATERAGAAYQLAVHTDPSSIDARIGYARALVRGRKEARALRVLDRADDVLAERGGERSTALLTIRGRALLELKRRAEAAEVLLEAAERGDARPEVFFYLGEALAGRKTSESRAAYERYLELDPEGAHEERAKRAIER